MTVVGTAYCERTAGVGMPGCTVRAGWESTGIGINRPCGVVAVGCDPVGAGMGRPTFEPTVPDIRRSAVRIEGSAIRGGCIPGVAPNLLGDPWEA